MDDLVHPVTMEPLFTVETKDGVENCKLKAEYLHDPLPLSEGVSSTYPEGENQIWNHFMTLWRTSQMVECKSH